MWLVYSLLTFFAWGAADLFYKKGADPSERRSHLKTAAAVGLVMGAAAIVTLMTKDLHYDFRNLLIYLPVSAMYILSMTVGYFGLRYLEVSISSPIQNASGGVSALLLMIVLRRLPDLWTAVSIAAITAGVIVLGAAERRREAAAISAADKRYSIGFKAFFLPLIYCLLDSLGTFLDGWYLDDIASTPLLGVTEETLEDTANVSYQLTFLLAALLLLLYMGLKKEPFRLRQQGNRFLAALLETGGQLSYVYALSGNGIAAAPIIASYCVASLLLGRIFLKEKLERKQYFGVGLVIVGIIIMGILEVLE